MLKRIIKEIKGCIKITKEKIFWTKVNNVEHEEQMGKSTSCKMIETC